MIALFSMMDCGEKILYSRHVHDYQEFTDSKGVYYMLDGGCEYFRYTAPEGIKPRLVHSDEPIEFIREHLVWGKNYDKEGNRLPKTEWVFIKDITDDHLEGIITYLEEKELFKYPEVREFDKLDTYLYIFKKEKQFRYDNRKEKK